MVQPPKEFTDLLPKAAATEPTEGPVYWLWAFDPQEGTVTVDHNEGRNRADALTHEDLAGHITHPDKKAGFAYKIRGGYRISDREHKPVGDPFIAAKVVEAINNKLHGESHEAALTRENIDWDRLHYGRPMLHPE